MAKISLCMIALNEAAWIRGALQNSAPFVDEIIVVDGGSTDDTVAIATEFGALVIHEPWSEHFANQRNVGLGRATGDWILVMDPDETHERSLLESLQDFAANTEGFDIVGFPRRNLIDGIQTDAYPDVQWRYFKNGLGIKFYGRLHERPLGWKLMAVPADKHIVHDKPSARQQAQNARYESLKTKHPDAKDKWLRSLADPSQNIG